MIFVIDKRDAVLRYQSNSIRLEVDNKLIQRVPINQLSLVIVHGNPLAETAVWRYLSAANVPTVMLNSRGKNQVAMLGSGLATQLPLRLKQHELAKNKAMKLKLATWFVDKKIASYGLPFSQLCKNYQIDTETVECFIRQTKNTQTKLLHAHSIAEVMGLEGQYAQTWFKLLANNLPSSWRFKGRNRRPPKDPVNALLSLSYTLLTSEIRQSVLCFGFDPALGFLHQHVPGRDSLVLDVVELFRAGVDSFVLHCINQKILCPDNFYFRESSGCQLSKEARADYYKAWAIYRGNWPKQSTIQPGQIDTVPLGEQITGQLMLLRETMKSLNT